MKSCKEVMAKKNWPPKGITKSHGSATYKAKATDDEKLI